MIMCSDDNRGNVTNDLHFIRRAVEKSTSTTDAFGTTTADRLRNGLLNKSILSDGRTITVNARDTKTYIPTNITRADGKFTAQSVDAHGQISGQSGAGVIPAIFGRSSQNGALTTLTTNGSATTTWNYTDPTGLLTSKTYAGGDN